MVLNGGCRTWDARPLTLMVGWQLSLQSSQLPFGCGIDREPAP